MSKKILAVAVLLSLVVSVAASQEASALTRGSGQHSRTTASLDPSRVCGDHVCRPGENSKWLLVVHESQRQGPGKATGAQHGDIVMHQMVVNAWMKAETAKQAPKAAENMPAITHPTRPATNATMPGSMTNSTRSTGQ